MYASVDNEIADVVQLEGYAGPSISKLQPNIVTSLRTYNELSNSEIYKIHQHWFQTGLQHGTLRAACDGSYKPRMSSTLITAAWSIESDDVRHNMNGTIATNGIKSDSYRAELLGIYTKHTRVVV